jgi:hypothetical protein
VRIRPPGLALAVLALLALAPAAQAQGGAPAPDFSEPCPALYPGDEAGRERIARWMARGAADRGLPHELPVMAGIAESGLRNIRGGSYHGFFGMHGSLNRGDYRGFPRDPELQLRWFLDTAGLVRQRRVAEGRADPAGDPGAWGTWIADVERPAPENRDSYQPHLDEARRLVASRCAAPEAPDTEPPRLRVRIPRPQAPLSAGGVVLRVRCLEVDCLIGASAKLAGVRRTVRTAAVTAPERGFATLTIRLPRAARRALARGESLRARVTAHAADTAANVTTRARRVTLVGLP